MSTLAPSPRVKPTPSSIRERSESGASLASKTPQRKHRSAGCWVRCPEPHDAGAEAWLGRSAHLAKPALSCNLHDTLDSLATLLVQLAREGSPSLIAPT